MNPADSKLIEEIVTDIVNDYAHDMGGVSTSFRRWMIKKQLGLIRKRYSDNWEIRI